MPAKQSGLAGLLLVGAADRFCRHAPDLDQSRSRRLYHRLAAGLSADHAELVGAGGLRGPAVRQLQRQLQLHGCLLRGDVGPDHHRLDGAGGSTSVPPGILLWRSILQWLGGIGIIVMAIAVLPFLQVGGMQLFRVEARDRQGGAARGADLAAYIGLLYLGLTAACAAVYRLAGMSGFDAVNHAMTTLSTGGYSTHDASFGYFANPAVQWAGIVFMLSGGLPFVAYIRTLRGKQPVLWHDSQVQTMLGFWRWRAPCWYLSVAWRRAAVFPVAAPCAVQCDFDRVTTTGFATATTSYGAPSRSVSFSC